MKYTFAILGVSPILYFFNQQQEKTEQKKYSGVEYVASYKCTLDAVIQSVETAVPKRGWNLEEVVDTVVDFWLQNSDTIAYWKERLKDAGNENLLVGRVADPESLRAEFESLFGKNK